MSTNISSLPALQFNVAGLLKGPVGGTRVYDLKIPAADLGHLDESLTFTEPLVGAVRFLRTGETILTVMNSETEVQLDCSRCLERYDSMLAVEFEEEYHPSVDIFSGRPIAERGDDAALIIDEQHVLDLSELVRQAMIVALPFNAICKEDCKGLCQSCGANLNQETCECVDTSTDPRWEALGALLQIDQEETKPEEHQ